MADISIGYDFNDIVTFVKDEVGDDDSDMVDAIKRWINRGLVKLNASRHPIFDKSSTFATVDGQLAYTLSGTATIGISDGLSSGNILAVRFVGRPNTNGWGRKLLTEKAHFWIRAHVPDPADVSDLKGAPAYFARVGVTSAFNQRIQLYKIPDAAANMPYVFTERLKPLSSASAGNVLTVNYPELLTKFGVYGGWKRKTDLEQAAIARGDLSEALAEFWADTKGETEPEGFTEASSVQGGGIGFFNPLNQ